MQSGLCITAHPPVERWGGGGGAPVVHWPLARSRVSSCVGADDDATCLLDVASWARSRLCSCGLLKCVSSGWCCARGVALLFLFWCLWSHWSLTRFSFVPSPPALLLTVKCYTAPTRYPQHSIVAIIYRIAVARWLSWARGWNRVQKGFYLVFYLGAGQRGLTLTDHVKGKFHSVTCCWHP